MHTPFNHVIYENDGELDMRSITVMGVNAKLDAASAIGYFGTGLKMAIAALTRMECAIYIHDGRGNLFTVLQSPDEFRGKSFNFLKLSTRQGKKIKQTDLPFTTDLAKDWEMWMCLRELESNMKDEGGRYYLAGSLPASEYNKIRVIVRSDKYCTSLENMRRLVWFNVDRQPTTLLNADQSLNDYRLPVLEILPVPTDSIYSKGIVVSQTQKKLRYTYNMVGGCQLTEDRTMKYTWDFTQRLRRAFMSDTSFAARIWRFDIMMDMEYWEWQMLGISTEVESWDEDVLSTLYDNRHTFPPINDQMRALFAKYRMIHMEKEKPYVPDDDEQEMLADACERLQDMGYPIKPEMVRVVRQLHGDNAFGEATRGERGIFTLSKMAFEHGLENVMATCLEEWAHADLGHHDESRAMQDWLLRQVVVQGQRYIREKARRQGGDTYRQAKHRTTDAVSDDTSSSIVDTEF